MRRLFLAVPVPSEVSAYREQLKKENHIEGIKWMRLHNLHLTGYFIGNVESGLADELVSAIRPVIRMQKKFIIHFESVAFAPSRHPRMIWLRFHKSEDFTRMASEINEAVSQFIPNNKFHHKDPFPHITLARFHNKIYRHNEIKLPPFSMSPLSVSALELWESKPSDEGVRYESMEVIPFG